MLRAKNIWVVGGDPRQAALAGLLADDGHTVHTFALEQGEGVTCQPNMKEAYRADCIILPLPAAGEGGTLNAPLSSGTYSLETILDALRPGQLVCAGMAGPELYRLAEERELTLADYFAREELAVLNAIPTAEGAIQIAMEELPITLHDSRVLIIGFGRIGRLLAPRLKALGARVTVAARRYEQRALAQAMGLGTERVSQLTEWLCGYDLVINTAPGPVLGLEELSALKEGALVIDLASKPGGDGGIFGRENRHAARRRAHRIGAEGHRKRGRRYGWKRYSGGDLIQRGWADIFGAAAGDLKQWGWGGARAVEPLRIGLYLRLSRDDEREGESQSIANQRRLLRQYVQARGWTAAEEYSDDGYTGTNFDRPAFQRLLGDIEAKKINTVITKDLSRLGRDQIMTAYYYQIYFPQKRVRYIAVAEGFDTADGGAGSVLLPFLTAANDFYTADISRKVRSALTARTREGKFIGSEAPLGYRKDPLEKGHLVIDPAGAEIIRRIFRLYQSLGSIAGTARALTEEKVPTPAEYRGGGRAVGRFPGVWSGEMVRRVLTNPTYMGDLTQHRTEKINYKLRQRTVLPPERWVVVPGTHEPVIDREQFGQVQEMLRVRGYQAGKRGAGHLLTGLAFCADCGSPMTYVRESPSRTYMVCQGYRKGGRLRLCTSHRVREDRVVSALQTQLCRLGEQIDRERLAARDKTGKRHEQIRSLLFFEPLDRGTVAALVRRVLVRQDRTVEIQFRFRRPD